MIFFVPNTITNLKRNYSEASGKGSRVKGQSFELTFEDFGLRIEVGYCPHTGTAYIKGHIKDYI